MFFGNLQNLINLINVKIGMEDNRYFFVDYEKLTLGHGPSEGVRYETEEEAAGKLVEALMKMAGGILLSDLDNQEAIDLAKAILASALSLSNGETTQAYIPGWHMMAIDLTAINMES